MAPDAELIARVLAGDDRRAFAELVRRHERPVRGLLRRLCAGDAALADDLAQETFLRAYRGLSGYRGTARFSTWLYRVAYTAFLSHARASRTQELPEVDHTTSGSRALLRHDLERALGALAPVERMVLVLAYGADVTHEEIATILGLPLGTVKTHILRSKERLRRALGAWDPGSRVEGSP